MTRRRSAFWGNIALLAASIAVATILGEVAYRVWLGAKLQVLARPVSYDPKPSFGIYNEPPWSFDRDAGFAYVPGLRYWTAYIKDGAYHSCAEPFVMTNARGNIGAIHGSYEDAALKVLVFADSFGTMHFDGDTWPNLLQRKLEAAIGKKVHVVNFGRDSYGLLQMVDLAQREVPKWKPDIVIFAFITNDLGRPRYWRVLKEVRGYWRFIQAMEPDEGIEPGPNTTTNEVGLINPKITRDWCARMAARSAKEGAEATRDDPVVRELVEQYNTIRKENARQIIDPADVDLLTLKHAYLFNRIVRGDTFRGTGVRSGKVGYRTIDLMSFHEDAQFVRGLERVRATGARIFLIHFPVRPEVERNVAYDWNTANLPLPDQGPSLLKSLEELMGGKAIGLLPYFPGPIRDFRPYTASETDWHPNRKGVDLYSDAVLKALLERGVGAPPKPRRRRPAIVRRRRKSAAAG